mmetsp:Transcript_81146/g.148112  ORF Transcript_81146/g.148112 Transcript_81146/m.148112 type:complete len:104 (-) Transcript_81146:6-317(-)
MCIPLAFMAGPPVEETLPDSSDLETLTVPGLDFLEGPLQKRHVSKPVKHPFSSEAQHVPFSWFRAFLSLETLCVWLIKCSNDALNGTWQPVSSMAAAACGCVR